ncbi:MAG TPA: SAM-dependent methyltransferase [Candidatus Limnocylindria bacterium]|nr:SAM-dependent methyltransferase [Candidatus Limnocylindria bacterium]
MHHDPTSTAGSLIPAERDPASFRDPTGFVYRRGDRLYRQVNETYAQEWAHFLDSGLYARLVERGWLVAHTEVDRALAFDDRAWKVLEVERVPFVSYPYEWTFGQLKDAALLTLDVQAAAIEAGMTLKDASAYNVLFDGARPVLIDGLSFEHRAEDEPWVAYRQFCQHFLAPLALMALRDVRAGLLLRDFIDGIPLDLAAGLLPGSSRLRLGLAAHLHLHARAQRDHATDGARPDNRAAKLSRGRLEALIESLRSAVGGLRWQPSGTEWSEYGETTSYSPAGAASKRVIVERFLGATDGEWVWDLGANTGFFSRLAGDSGRKVVALDADPGAAERHYLHLRETQTAGILPLVMDLTNPSPSLGWAHRERRSLVERANADVLIALALVHHVAIGNNVPLPQLSGFLAELGRQLIVEFVPKSDPRVAAMLASRHDVFPDYSLDGLKAAFAADWRLVDEEPVEDSERTLLRFHRADQAA